MAEFPFLPIDVRAFLADTQHLDARESGAYAMLLFHGWLAPDNALPDDDKRLAFLARCTPREWVRIKVAVMSFWRLDADGRWHQKRLDKTKFEVGVKSSKASAAAQAKWLKWHETRRAAADAYAGPKQMPKPPPSISNHNHKLEEESLTQNLTEPARDAAPERSSSASRARRPGKSAERMAELAALHHRKSMGHA